MRRAFLLPVLLAAGLAGCGESGNDLIPERTAGRMLEFVDRVETEMAKDEPDCSQAREAAEAGRRRAAGLSSKVDEELKQNLIDWFEHLEDEVRKDCRRRQEPKDTPTPDPTPSATAEPEDTPTPAPTPSATATPEPTPSGTPTPEPTQDPGGAGAPEDEEGGDE